MDTLPLIPYPSHIEQLPGQFRLERTTQFLYDPDQVPDFITQWFRDEIEKYYALRLPTPNQNTDQDSGTIIRLVIDRSLLSPSGMRSEEGYQLHITEWEILLAAPAPEGLFRGLQTLLQLVPPESCKEGCDIPCLLIRDWPRFSWRGMHLDVSRHFFPVANIKKFIDILTFHKMNIFHWHLTDDQGWRIESRLYPKLTEIGAWRTEKDGSRYGGFYTCEEIADIVEYAAQRYITVVPEVDVPGHTMAVLAAYPELSCTGKTVEVPATWGIFKDVLCPGNQDTMEFVYNLLRETMELFPGPYFHIGGDECPTDRWKKCSKCQEMIRSRQLGDVRQLQPWFTRTVGRGLEKAGKRMIGWDEILNDTLPPGTIVQAWRDMSYGTGAAEMGYDVIMSPTSHCYFDYYQARLGEPKAIGGYLPWEKVYEFDPVPRDISAEAASHILGGQANIWTEYMDSWDHVEYMTLPRLSALAEVLWIPAMNRSKETFEERINAVLPKFTRRSYHYRPL